ncbi:MAG TPA: hypothetical protein DCX61_04040, partial [Gemmatimonadetes bacterium]|nr:hypothetical protein [Gemmatimonadota bacterium]
EKSFRAAVFYLHVTNFLGTNYQAFGIVSRNLRGPTEAVERFLTPGHPAELTAGIRVHLQP